MSGSHKETKPGAVLVYHDRESARDQSSWNHRTMLPASVLAGFLKPQKGYQYAKGLLEYKYNYKFARSSRSEQGSALKALLQINRPTSSNPLNTLGMEVHHLEHICRFSDRIYSWNSFIEQRMERWNQAVLGQCMLVLCTA